MATPREIRRRIRSVRSVSQITKAMETVSASRLRRAQQRVLAGRPFMDKMRAVLSNLSGQSIDDLHPLLVTRPVKRTSIVIVSPDRGLCGPLVTNLVRRAARFVMETAPTPASFVSIGRKGRDFVVRTGQELVAESARVPAAPELLDITPAAHVVIDSYTSGQVDEVLLLYSEFISISTQRPRILRLLPITPETESRAQSYRQYIYEPNPGAILEQLLPRYVEVLIYQAVLEAIASEHAARMIAMHNATEAAVEMVGDLTLSLNRARQAGITREVAEISTAAEALAG